VKPAIGTRIVLVVLETLMGLIAVASGPALIATNGLGMPAGWMENSPFGSYAIPGVVLLVVGVVNLAGAVGVLRRRRWGASASAVAGLMWVGWFVVQVAVVGFVSWQQPFYFVIGLMVLALAAYLLRVRERAGETGRRLKPPGRPGRPWTKRRRESEIRFSTREERR
jgi:hypothetical protein